MNKKLKNYYQIIFVIVLAQLISCVVTISQNIAYGQQIEVLNQKQQALISKESQLNQAIAQEISLQQLAEHPDFKDTTDFLVVKVKDNSVALR